MLTSVILVSERLLCNSRKEVKLGRMISVSGWWRVTESDRMYSVEQRRLPMSIISHRCHGNRSQLRLSRPTAGRERRDVVFIRLVNVLTDCGRQVGSLSGN